MFCSEKKKTHVLLLSPIISAMMNSGPTHVWHMATDNRLCEGHVTCRLTYRMWVNMVKQNLVGGLKPSEKYWSVGMIIPNIWKKFQTTGMHQRVDGYTYDGLPKFIFPGLINRNFVACCFLFGL